MQVLVCKKGLCQNGGYEIPTLLAILELMLGVLQI